VNWRNHEALPTNNDLIRLRFELNNASLFSFMAGENVEVIEEQNDDPVPAVLIDAEGDAGRRLTDKMTEDGAQQITFHGLFKVDRDEASAASGKCSLPLGSEFSPRSAIEIAGTRELGTQFTLALKLRSNDNRHCRLFSSYDDIGAVQTSELVFDCDPSGRVLDRLRLICKGIETWSKPVRFEDGKYHHLAVTYDDGLITFYKDGQSIGEDRVPPGEPVTMQNNLYVGEDTRHGRQQQLNGHVDDIVIYGRALPADTIRQLSREPATTAMSTFSQ
jgi:hypothetical protein